MNDPSVELIFFFEPKFINSKMENKTPFLKITTSIQIFNFFSFF